MKRQHRNRYGVPAYYLSSMKYADRFALLITLPLLAFTQDSWVTQSFGDQLQVLLPGAAKEMGLAKLQGNWTNTRMWMAGDAHALYQIMRMQLPPQAGLPKTEDAESRRKFYDDVINGLLGTQVDATLLQRSTFPTAGGEGFEIKFRARHEYTHKLVVKYSRGLLVGNAGYSFNFSPRDLTDTVGTSAVEQRRRFFSSITVVSVPGK